MSGLKFTGAVNGHGLDATRTPAKGLAWRLRVGALGSGDAPTSGAEPVSGSRLLKCAHSVVTASTTAGLRVTQAQAGTASSGRVTQSHHTTITTTTTELIARTAPCWFISN